MPQQVAPGGVGQGALLAGQQRRQVHAVPQRGGGQRLAEGVHGADQVVLLDGRTGGPHQRLRQQGADAQQTLQQLAQSMQQQAAMLT